MGKDNEKIQRKEERQRGQVLLRRRLLTEAFREIQPLALGSLALLASSFSNQAFPRLMGRLIDFQNNNPRSANSHTLASERSSLSFSLGLVVLGGGLASFVRTTMLKSAEDSIAARLRKQAFQSLMMTKDLEWFQTETVHDSSSSSDDDDDDDDTEQTSTALSNVEQQHSSTQPSATGVSPAAIGAVLDDDVAKISSSLTVTTANILRSTSSVVASTYHMLNISPTLLAVSATVVPVVGAAAMLLSKSIRSITGQQREMAADQASFVEERLTNIAMVKLSNRQADDVDCYNAMLDKSLLLARKASIHSGLFMGFIFAASSAALLLVINAGGKLVAAGKMSTGQLGSFCTYSFLLGLGTSGVVKGWTEFMQGCQAAERFYKLLVNDDDEADAYMSVEETVDDDGGTVNVDATTVDTLIFKDVCFGYKSTGGKVLKHISFELERGKVVALVGKNGSGKSTTGKLLAGLYRPDSGRIELSDGTDFTQLSRTSKKHLVQVIPQSTALFNTSILENVRYSNPNASEEEVLEALKSANCDGFVSKLENGIYFSVGLNGCKLSGGERQRLALARALLSDPAFLVLDEAASSLDAEGENAISDAIKACRGDDKDKEGRALLLITHQTKILELADMVVVLKNGAIIEAGQFEDLRSNENSELRRQMPDLF